MDAQATRPVGAAVGAGRETVVLTTNHPSIDRALVDAMQESDPPPPSAADR